MSWQSSTNRKVRKAKNKTNQKKTLIWQSPGQLLQKPIREQVPRRDETRRDEKPWCVVDHKLDNQGKDGASGANREPHTFSIQGPTDTPVLKDKALFCCSEEQQLQKCTRRGKSSGIHARAD